MHFGLILKLSYPSSVHENCCWRKANFPVNSALLLVFSLGENCLASGTAVSIRKISASPTISISRPRRLHTTKFRERLLPGHNYFKFSALCFPLPRRRLLLVRVYNRTRLRDMTKTQSIVHKQNPEGCGFRINFLTISATQRWNSERGVALALTLS